MGISAFIPVYNEEKRIKYALSSIQWCDEIIVLDKYSSDKTVEIAKTFEKVKVYEMEYSSIYSANELNHILSKCSNDWIILFTASDIMDVDLSIQIQRLVHDTNFNYDIIKVPYRRYILGIDHKNSPWYGKEHSSVFRKSILNVNQNEVHAAISFNSNKIYSIEAFKNNFIHHLTHETVDVMMDRHLRYWRGEGQNYNEPNLTKAFRQVLRGFKNVFIKKKTYLIGWDGVMLMCAYLSYSMMSFVYKWEHINKGKIENKYNRMRNISIQNWVDAKKNE